jgi:hypothetical protein
MDTVHITKPRCFLVYALAPANVSPADANRRFNAYIADRSLPLVVFHDHFIGRRGGVAMFYAETDAERAALQRSPDLLEGWQVDVQPLIFSHSPAAFDEQIAFTLYQYRGQIWESLRRKWRPAYGNPAREVETAQEADDLLSSQG